MKEQRQKLILEVISGQLVETQQQLQALMAENGVHCTQATLSRDLRTLGIVKQMGPGGTARYGLNPLSMEDNDLHRLLNIVRMATLSVEAAQNLIVIKTLPGLAGAVGSFADRLERYDVVGSIAGNDTILMVMRDDQDAAALVRMLQELLSGERSLP